MQELLQLTDVQLQDRLYLRRTAAARLHVKSVVAAIGSMHLKKQYDPVQLDLQELLQFTDAQLQDGLYMHRVSAAACSKTCNVSICRGLHMQELLQFAYAQLQNGLYLSRIAAARAMH